MMKIIASIFVLFPFMVIAGQDINQGIVNYCNTPSYSVKHSVSIGDVTGIGFHHYGFMMVTKTANDPGLKARLLMLAQQMGLPDNCLEYLDGKQLLSVQRNVDGTGSLLARIYFDFDRSTLTPMSRDILDRVGHQLSASEQLVRIEGNTDSIGSKPYNYSLGLMRAKQSRDYLLDEGVDKTQLSVISRGELMPISSNATAAGRKDNRRVDIYPDN
ncbi:OmpA family protein [Photobacterium nomapromontoriensis]|uniref:OmpA family protein n=1 Tax=Photobacterium nomapromontoriensis TaxID=2910237 RepID=UPI003D0AFDDF